MREIRTGRAALLRRAAAVAALATAMAACGGGSDGEDLAPDSATMSSVVEVPGVTRVEPVKGAPVSGTVEGMTAFAAELYAAAADPARNTVFSPLSIAYAFAMARAGAAGETAAALDKAFGFPGGVDGAFNALTRGLVTTDAPPPTPAPDPGPSPTADRPPAPPILAIANGLFTQRDFDLAQAFLTTLVEQYGSEVRTVDFGSPDDALAAVNEWARIATAGRIPEILTSVDPLTRLVLANAVYLKADWTAPFTAAGEEDFEVAGRAAPVPMMTRTSQVGYAKGQGWQAVELPYFGDRLAMRVIVPTGSRTPADLLTPAVLAAAAKTAPQDVALTLPRWDFGTTLDLRALMRGLGITVPFDPDRADFSGMSAEALYISQAVHKANITVDELGTEASAVTALGVSTTSMPADPPLELRADRPFAFVIVDTATGTPLFLGHVADPRQG